MMILLSKVSTICANCPMRKGSDGLYRTFYFAVMFLIIMAISTVYYVGIVNFALAQEAVGPNSNLAVAIIIDDSFHNVGSDPNFIRGTAAKQLIDMLDSLSIIGSLLLQSRRQRLRALNHEGTVHHKQILLGNRADSPLGTCENCSNLS